MKMQTRFGTDLQSFSTCRQSTVDVNKKYSETLNRKLNHHNKRIVQLIHSKFVILSVNRLPIANFSRVIR
jgi:hypothetical protein